MSERERKLTVLDKAFAAVSPRWALKRAVARDHLYQFAAVRRCGRARRAGSLRRFTTRPGDF